MAPPCSRPALARLSPALATGLAGLAGEARPADLLSLTLALDWPAETQLPWADGPDVLAWQDGAEAWLALGSACMAVSAGPGRFPALQAVWQGLQQRWRHRDLGREEGAPPLAHLGFAFHDESPAASPLPNARLAVPALLLRRRAGGWSLTLACPAEAAPQALAHWEGLWQRLGRPLPGAAPEPRLERQPAPLPDRAFLARCRAALAAIRAGELDKVVLSRQARLQGPAPAAAVVFAALLRQQADTACFAVGHRDGVFLGATPEHLLHLEKGRLRTEALAGTAWNDAGAGADSRQAVRTLGSDKNRREHGWVAEAIHRTLAPLCHELQQEEARILHLGDALSHLRTPFHGRPREGIGLLDLAARLHPTPAVGGWPALAARSWLQAHGEARPYWYSGGLGWLDRSGDGALAVPLRCANLHARGAELQAGAGIVAGSDPAQELAETEAKFVPMLAALAAAGEAAEAPGTSTLPPLSISQRSDSR